MEPTNVYYEGLLHQLSEHYSPLAKPRFVFGIVDPASVKLNRAQHSLRFQKSDQIDVAAIGELLTRGLYTPVHFASLIAWRIRELATAVANYERDQARHWNRLLVTTERVFPNLLIDYQQEKPLVRNASRSVLFSDLLHLSPDPAEIQKMESDGLIALFHQQGRRLGPVNASKIQQAAQRALLLPSAIRSVHRRTLEHQLQTLDFIHAQIAQLRAEMAELLLQTPARHLSAIAGSSVNLTLDLLAAMGDWQRFHSIQTLWATAGLRPQLHQSGGGQLRPRLTKDGSSRLRQAIYQMTCSVIWHEPTFGIPCFQRLIDGAPFVHTIIHIGRKLSNTILAILKTDSPFQSSFPDQQAAKSRLLDLQRRYSEKRKKEQAKAANIPTPQS